MKYIVTDFFEKQFNKIVKDLDIKNLISKININSKKFIGLRYPFFKIKLKSKNKTYRVLVSYNNEDSIILFVNIFDKKDKKFGENINWELHEKDIVSWTLKNMQCIESGKYYNIYY